MKKETYSKPIVEIEKFKMLDVVTTSTETIEPFPQTRSAKNVFDLEA